ncbi:THAP domain-containing protein 5-like [Ostrea edulis]|uniref:THAP domain-containing protein 5-like n=1 Tax=Ostrea edulis TaxID=37623 RepID=UPI0024AEE597|nr:THAP domain-containing protein 5-like [Ostrea edulis]
MIVRVCLVNFGQIYAIRTDKDIALVSERKMLWELRPLTRTRHIETIDADQQETETSNKQHVNMVLCAAPNCNVQCGKGIAMFNFPTDTKNCEVWVRKLKTVDYWPSKHSKLCERHFTEDCFVTEPSKARSLGYSRLQLKKEAIPTVFNYTPLHVPKGQKRKTDSDPLLPKQKSRTSRAVEKRGTTKVCFNIDYIKHIGYFIDINPVILGSFYLVFTHNLTTT